MNEKPNAVGVDVLLNVRRGLQVLSEWRWFEQGAPVLEVTIDSPVLEARSFEASGKKANRHSITLQLPTGETMRTPDLREAEIVSVSIPPVGYRHVLHLEWLPKRERWTLAERC